MTKDHWPFYIRIDREEDIAVLRIEDIYQAFKERLMADIAATRPSGVNVYVGGISVDYLPLKEIAKTE